MKVIVRAGTVMTQREPSEVGLGFQDLIRMGMPPPDVGPEEQTITGCSRIEVRSGAKVVQRHFGAPPELVRGDREHIVQAAFNFEGGGGRKAEWTPAGWQWFPEEKPAPARTRLVLISATGQQTEARCDRCRHWTRLRGDAGKCAVIPSQTSLATIVVDASFGPHEEEFQPTECFGCVLFEAPP